MKMIFRIILQISKKISMHVRFKALMLTFIVFIDKIETKSLIDNPCSNENNKTSKYHYGLISENNTYEKEKIRLEESLSEAVAVNAWVLFSGTKKLVADVNEGTADGKPKPPVLTNVPVDTPFEEGPW